MKASTVVFALLALALGAEGIALPAPARNNAPGRGNTNTRGKTNTRGNANTRGNTNTRGATNARTGGNAPGNNNCAAERKLAAGIDANIKIQQQELRDVQAVGQAINAGNQQQFASSKQRLLSTIDKGVQVRQNNQKIAPQGNGAIPGLKVVEGAQAQERSQAQGLKGTKGDLATVKKLETEFNGGIKKNQENKAAALKNCGKAGGTAPGGTAPGGNGRGRGNAPGGRSAGNNARRGNTRGNAPGRNGARGKRAR